MWWMVFFVQLACQSNICNVTQQFPVITNNWKLHHCSPILSVFFSHRFFSVNFTSLLETSIFRTASSTTQLLAYLMHGIHGGLTVLHRMGGPVPQRAPHHWDEEYPLLGLRMSRYFWREYWKVFWMRLLKGLCIGPGNFLIFCQIWGTCFRCPFCRYTVSTRFIVIRHGLDENHGKWGVFGLCSKTYRSSPQEHNGTCSRTSLVQIWGDHRFMFEISEAVLQW